MTEVVEEIVNGDKRAEILYDELAEDPRSWYDHIGKMVCMHKRYKLGDEQLNENDFDCWEQVGNYLTEERDAKVILPLYLYDHSGITMSTRSFNDRWDSGMVGFIYVDRATCVKEFGEKFDVAKIEQELREEIEEYDDYLTGQVYWFRIFEKQEYVETCPHCNEVIKREEEEVEIDSCGGFYGIDRAREAVKEELGIC
jgi:hypothetical protein